MSRSLYDILGVSETATEKEITDAFTALTEGMAEDDARFVEIRNAYSVLSDMDRRARYDIQGKASVSRRHRKGSQSSNGIAKARYILNTLFLQPLPRFCSCCNGQGSALPLFTFHAQ